MISAVPVPEVNDPHSHPGQLLLVGLPGPELEPETARLLRDIQPGGYIIFTRNLTTPQALRRLLDDLRDLSKIEPIITIDQEGGRVSRLREFGHEPPNAQQLREHGDIEAIREQGKLTGELLRLFGFNLDLCPVLDISTNDDADNSLRGRCYGTGVEQTVAFAGAFNDALREAGIASCAKHFPGYGAAEVDPHWEMPAIRRTREELESFELQPYRQMLDRIDSIMTCHSFFPALEAQPLPASLSARIIQELLRDEMRYQGLIMTDDLDMGAILNTYGADERLSLALAAGNDLLMICHQLETLPSAKRTLDTQPPEHLERALSHVARFKEGMKPPVTFSLDEFEHINQRILELRVRVLGEERARERSPEDGKRSPVETY